MEKKKSNFPKFMLLWSGELVSAIGGGLTSFGLGVYVFRQMGSAAGMALVTLLAFLPTLLLSVPAGVLADCYDRRILMMIGDGFSAIGILYILICMLQGIYLICCFGFLFFAMLPFANNCLDYLVRTNIPDELQGRAWGMIGFLSQIGYVVAYGAAGVTADEIAKVTGMSVGRGAALVIMAAGVLLGVTAMLLYLVKSVRALEKGGVYAKKADRE